MFENVINNWTAAMDGFRLFSTDRLGRPNEGLAIYIREKHECMELCFGMSQEPVKSLWVSGQTNMGAAVVVICCRPVLVLAEI